ncbi:recombinase family protein [Nocardia niigatensis]
MSSSPLRDFTPAVLFLSIAARSEADLAAGGEPIGIQLQRESGLRTADHHQLGIVKEFVEIGAAATSLRRRPVMRRMLRYLIAHPEVTIAIVPAPHRFSRSAGDAEHLHTQLGQLGVDVIASVDRSMHSPI